MMFYARVTNAIQPIEVYHSTRYYRDIKDAISRFKRNIELIRGTKDNDRIVWLMASGNKYICYVLSKANGKNEYYIGNKQVEYSQFNHYLTSLK